MTLETANRLVTLRKENGYSQEALAEKLGLSRQAVSKWERGEASPDTDNLIALASIYGLTLDQLLNTDFGNESDSNEKENPPAYKEKKPKNKRQLLGIKMLKFPTPIIVIIIYLICGLVFHSWHPTWIIFFIIPIYYHLAGALTCRYKKPMLLAMPVPEVIIMLYAISGFCAHFWHPSWIMFFIIPLYYWIIAVFYKDAELKKHHDEKHNS